MSVFCPATFMADKLQTSQKYLALIFNKVKDEKIGSVTCPGQHWSTCEGVSNLNLLN